MLKSLLSLAFSAMLVVVCPALADGNAPIVIKFSHVVTDDTPKGKGALLFKKLVEERLAGQVTVEVYPNSTLFGDANEMEALRANKVQMLAPSLSKFGAYTKKLQLFDLPFLFDDQEAVKRFLKRDKSRELLSSMTAHNLYGLAFWINGMKQLSATREIHQPLDAKGLTFRIQPSAVIASQFQEMGASTVTLPFDKTFAALQSGEVQGAANPWSNIASQKFDSVQPYITETNHSSLNYMLVSNSSFWSSIPYKIRSELDAIVEEVTFIINQEAEALNQSAREQVNAGGKTKIITLTTQEKDVWRTAMQPVWKNYEDEIGSDLLRAAQAVSRR